MGSQLSVHILHSRNKDLLTSASQSKLPKKSKSMASDVKSKLAEDVRRLTNAASRWKIGKKKDKVAQTLAKDAEPVKDSFKMSPPAPVTKTSSSPAPQTKPSEQKVTTYTLAPSPRPEQVPSKPSPRPVNKAKGLPQRIVAATRVSERKWSISDLLHNLGAFVQGHCLHLHNVPSPNEVAMWVRCADRALQLNGWTINTFLLESHVIFTYMLIASAIRHGYELYTLTDVKELVLMCLYVSYTYNANEISYPLRPFLVKQDRASFWDKCTSVSLSASSNMLKLNRDRTYYNDVLTSLKKVSSV